MRVALAVLGAALPWLAGCAQDPVRFRLDVVGPASASAVVRVLGAKSDAAPTRCSTPCPLVFEPETAYEIELHAPGHQRARVPVSFATLFLYQLVHGDEDLILRIPMLPRDAGSEP